MAITSGDDRYDSDHLAWYLTGVLHQEGVLGPDEARIVAIER